jgi:predicted permease
LLVRLTVPLIPDDTIPRLGEVGINLRVLCFSATISLLCAVLSSLLPAWKLSSTQPIDALREQGPGKTGSRHAHRLQNTQVIAQTALGFTLLVASGLLIRGFVNVRHVKTGFNPDSVLAFLLPLTPTRYPDAKKVLFYDELLPKLAALPGVRSVSAASPLPLRGSYDSASVEIDGRPNPPYSPLTTLVGVAEPGFFETLQIPLLRGRNFTAQDNKRGSPLVAVVNQAFVKRYFPDEDPIGRHIRPDLSELRNQAKDIDPTSREEREIIGVVGDFQQDSLTAAPQPFAAFPYAQASALMRPRVVMRVAGDPLSYDKAAQAVVSSIDPNLFLLAPNSMTLQLAEATGSQRFETVLISTFAVIALILTGLGLYASLAGMVASRTREIGVRVAVGARRNHIATLVLVRAAVLVLAGVSLGGIVALAGLRALQAASWWSDLLFGVSWFEPATYCAIFLTLGIVSFAACLVPTWRAVRIDPMRVLRDE